MTEKDTQSDSTDSERAISRRDAIKAGSALTATALLSKYRTPADVVSAQTTEPRLQLGDDWAIDDDADGSGNNDLRLEHQPTGAELRYDVSAGAWKPTAEVDMGGNPVSNVSDLSAASVSTQDLDIGGANLVTSGDFLPLYYTGDSGTESKSDTNLTAYQGDRVRPLMVWDNFPDGADISINLTVRGEANGDAIDIAVRNSTDGEIAISKDSAITGSGVQTVQISPTPYTPPTTDSPVSFTVQFSNNDGATTVDLYGAYIKFGVQL